MAVLRCALSVLVLAVLCLDGRRGASARCLNAGWDILDRVPVKASNAAVRGVSAVDELALREYLSGEYERGYTALCNRANLAQWNYNVDLLNQTIQDEGDASSLALAAFTKEQWEKHFKSLDETQIKDSQLRRQVSFLKSLGKAALSSEELSHFNERQRAMTTTYSTAKVCPYKAQQCDPASEGLSLDPGIEEVISTSRDYDELLYIWKEWHDKSGKKMREDYKEYVALSNKAARANGFNDMGEMWQGMYEVDEFQATIDKLWQEVSPLYQELHTYTLNKLKKVYAGKISDDATLIPGHVLGNMWGQSWINLYDLLVPYPDASSYDVTNALVKQGYTPRKMFETADEFYQSLGLPPNDMCYGPLAMIEKPTDGREVTCHASAWDLCDGTDFRVKMCTKVNQEDFRTIHHEMGHIQYFLQYAHLPSSLRDGANPGFHEAIGDTIALSVDTPKHLQKIKLLEDYTDTKESRVNALMKMALEKVAFLPFGLLVDMWRWDVFSGKVPESGWNAHWWSLREKYQLLSPPVDRSENDFDPGAKYHVPADSKYISYFVAHILEFQLYRAMCIEAGEYDPNNPDGAPLHTCDFYQSKKAGKKFGDGLALGASVHWTEVLQVMTGSSEMSGQALVEYFKPLHDFLREANGRSPSSAQLAAPGLLLALIVPLALLGLT